MPTSQCIRPVKSGLARLKAPRFCGFKRLMPMVCCPDSAYGSGGPSPYGPYQPLPPYGSGGRAYPHWPNYYPPGPSPYVPHQSMPPHGAGGWGYPNGPNYYPPGVGPQQAHGNSYGTGPVSPHRESSGGVPQGPAVTHGSVTPWKPTNPSGPQVPPDSRQNRQAASTGRRKRSLRGGVR
nr:proline-rich protein HaeIII subfamily 1-like isoform X3 [Rhipicephalus microplus]